MQFLVYLSVLMVSVSTVLLEIHWLTTPAPQPKAVVQASAPPRPRVEGPSAALSPVYPKKVEPVPSTQSPSEQSNIRSVTANNTTANPDADAPTGAGDLPKTPAKPDVAQRPVTETTGAATHGDDPGKTKNADALDRAHNAQASAVQPKQDKTEDVVAPNNHCDIRACASAYKSFRASDCTYQPFGGERRVCGKVPDQSADRGQRDEPQRRAYNRRDDDRDDARDVDRRTRWRVYDEDDDDADDAIFFRRSRGW
jgi:hypothetical protein